MMTCVTHVIPALPIAKCCIQKTVMNRFVMLGVLQGCEMTCDTSVAYTEALHSKNGNELVRYVRGASLGCDMCLGTSVASPWN